jgi:hypothetical protein
MTPNEQAVVDKEESPISLSQCVAKAGSADFIFDANLSTAVAVNGKVPSRQTCSTR